MLTVALFVIVPNWQQPRCPSTSEWFSEVSSICTVDNYSVIKRDGLATHATTWMDLEKMTLSGFGRFPKVTHHRVPVV